MKTDTKTGGADSTSRFSGYVPKPIQLELRKVWRLMHLEGKYKEGMSIIIELSGMPENRIDWKQPNTPNYEGT